MKPYYEDEWVTIYHADCADLLPIAADAVVTDPPYGYGSYATDTDGFPLLTDLIQSVSCAAVFGYPELLVRWCAETGLVPTEWVTWWPINGACRGFNLAGLRRESEHVAFFGKHLLASLRQPRDPKAIRRQYERKGKDDKGLSKGEEATRRLGDVWTDTAPGLAFQSKKRLHPNEKPITLLQRLVAGTTPPGGIVLDPFMGSGTTLRAAKNLGRKAIGIEIEERFCEVAASRMGQEVLAI